MSRGRFVPLVLLAASLALVAPALAETGPHTAAKGTIAAVEAKAVTLTLESPAEIAKAPGALRLALDDRTKVVRDGREIAVSELKPGDSVEVEYRSDAGKAVAVSISVVKRSDIKG